MVPELFESDDTTTKSLRMSETTVATRLTVLWQRDIF